MRRVPAPERIPGSPFCALPHGVRVRVRVTPGAVRSRIVGLEADSDGALALRVGVSVPPEKGRANAALIALLAREWRLPKSSLSVVAGASHRRKAIDIDGDPGRLKAKLEAWAAERDRAGGD